MYKCISFLLLFLFFPLGVSLPTTLTKYYPGRGGQSIPEEKGYIPAKQEKYLNPVSISTVKEFWEAFPKVEFSSGMTHEELKETEEKIVNYLFLLDRYTNDLLSQNTSMLAPWAPNEKFTFLEINRQEIFDLVERSPPDRVKALIHAKRYRLKYIIIGNIFLKAYCFIGNLFILPALLLIAYGVNQLNKKRKKIKSTVLRWFFLLPIACVALLLLSCFVATAMCLLN